MINDLADEETPEFIIENNTNNAVFDQSLKTDLYEDGVASFLSGTDTINFCRTVDPNFWDLFTSSINNGFQLKEKMVN